MSEDRAPYGSHGNGADGAPDGVDGGDLRLLGNRAQAYREAVQREMEQLGDGQVGNEDLDRADIDLRVAYDALSGAACALDRYFAQVRPRVTGANE